MTFLQSLSPSPLNRHHHFASIARFASLNDPIPRPPRSFGVIALSHATQLILDSSGLVPHKKFLLIRSNSSITCASARYNEK
ncbi:hypothetical protein HanRHA438_Chr15g0712881 [Helianthus annuus]|nr:hypothetical protein HanRHA438_Chr15g0712881 [Helianthus annuus]